MNCVMYQGSLVSVNPKVKKELNLVDFQEVNPEQLHQIISLNCSYSLANIYIDRIKNDRK